jgi:hypothetical protein
LLAVKYTVAPTGNLCFNALSITPKRRSAAHGPAATAGWKQAVYIACGWLEKPASSRHAKYANFADLSG